MYTFEIKVSPTESTATVLLNQNTINNQSQLWRCGTEPFIDWVRELPDMLFAELNNSYNLQFIGSDLECTIISGIFSRNPYCNSVSCNVENGRYNLSQRVEWAEEAAKELKILLSPKRIIGVDSDASCSLDTSDALKKLQGVKCNQFANGGCDVFITDNPANVTIASKNFKYVYLCTGEQMNFDNSVDNCMLFRGRREEIERFFSKLADLLVLKPFLEESYKKLSYSSTNAGFITKAKVEMLRDEVPHARLILTSQQIRVSNMASYRIEVGNRTSFSVEKFPDEKLKLNIRDPNILQMVGGREFLAVNVGKAHIDITFGNQKIWDGVIETYQVNRVTAIQMTPPNGSILEHYDFQVQYTFHPVNAQNISHAKWNVTPVGGLKDLGNGKFEALKHGTFTITLTVENVQESISVTVIRPVKSIRSPREVVVKVNHGGKPVSISTFPPGSGYSSMVIRSLDPNIAVWDGGRKEVRAISEGDTVLEIRALDDNNRDLATKRIPVYALPEKDIITLPYIPTVIAALIIVSFLCIWTPLVFVSTGIVVIMCIIWVVQRWKYGISQFSPRLAKYEILIILLYIIAALSALAYSIYHSYYYYW